MTPLLEAKNLRAAYGDVAVLFGLDLVLAAGTVTVLLGANGAGKTTTLRALSGMVRASGEILFDGRRIDGLATEEIIRLGLAHVPQGRGTIVRLTVEENLRLGTLVRRQRTAAARDIERVYEIFPALKDRRTSQAGALSGGEQQMLAIGRALVQRPRLMLLDEPSFGLAPILVQQLFAILTEISAQDGVSLLIVEQNAALALSIADRAYVLESGRIVMAGPARSLRERQEVEIRRSYLGEGTLAHVR